MDCNECLRTEKCTREWKGTPLNNCFIPGIDAWGTCSGCGMMRLKAQAEKIPCPICVHRENMTPAQWAKVKERLAEHQAVVLENAI